jgi:hypothetical protein
MLLWLDTSGRQLHFDTAERLSNNHTSDSAAAAAPLCCTLSTKGLQALQLSSANLSPLLHLGAAAVQLALSYCAAAQYCHPASCIA